MKRTKYGIDLWLPKSINYNISFNDFFEAVQSNIYNSWKIN